MIANRSRIASLTALVMLFAAACSGFARADPLPGLNILKDPGFETQSASWTPSPVRPPWVDDSAKAHGGSWYVRLGGRSNSDDGVGQVFTIPASTSRATLTFWYRVSSSTQFDGLIVSLVDAKTGAPLTNYPALWQDRGWTLSPSYDLSSLRGQTVRLLLVASVGFGSSAEFDLDDVAVLVDGPANHTGLWWNSAESGWGVNFTHQGDILFATLFVYDAQGAPLWLVMSNGAKQPGADSFSGDLYRTAGPPFDAQPFTPITSANLTRVGSMSVAFAGDAATLTYTVNGSTVSKQIGKQVFGAHAANCAGTTEDRGGLTNYQDLWWNSSESGWGVNITQQDQILFATLFTYRDDAPAANPGLWLVMSRGERQPDGTYAGDLYEARGPAFDANPFTPITAANLTRVGTMQFRFDSGTRGIMTYSVNGKTVVKSIERQQFSSPLPACAS